MSNDCVNVNGISRRNARLLDPSKKVETLLVALLGVFALKLLKSQIRKAIEMGGCHCIIGLIGGFEMYLTGGQISIFGWWIVVSDIVSAYRTSSVICEPCIKIGKLKICPQ